jgi:UTP:GlnB (protein PII) uridylyltransferase
VIKLACLLHDIGKPVTKSFQEDGRMRFFGHAAAGAELARKLMRRMHFSSRETKMVTGMVDAHMRPLQMAQQGPPSNRAIYRFFRDTGEAGADTLFLSLADHMAAVGPRLSMDGWRRHLAIISHILRRQMEDPSVISPVQLLRGDDLMTALGVAPGPELGRLLELVREAQAAGEVETKEEALDLARRHLEQPGATR